MRLPQDFFEDVMPEAITLFSRQRPNVHIEVRAGRNYALNYALEEEVRAGRNYALNYALEEEVRSGHLDLALAFVKAGRDKTKSA